MKVAPDRVGTLVRSVRPTAHAFASSAEGRDTLSNIVAARREPRRRRRWSTRAVLIVAGLGVAVAAGAGTAIATYQAPTVPSGWQPAGDGGSVMCATADLHGMADVPVKSGETPLDSCRRAWPDAFGQAAPQHLFACVGRVATQITPGVGPTTGSASGLVYVVDGDRFANAPETCGAVGMFVAPTQTGSAAAAPGRTLHS
jgi:hypothetical protein